MARLGADVAWVDPRQPKALAACLNELVADFSTVQAAALAQRGRLQSRSWVDVAADYMKVFEQVAIGRHAMQGAGSVPASVTALAGAAVGSHD